VNLEPKEVTAALVRATESGNYAARQGLIAALDLANTENQNPLELLKKTAADQTSSAARAFARAALREIDLTQAKE
jgi:hypothetical protein